MGVLTLPPYLRLRDFLNEHGDTVGYEVIEIMGDRHNGISWEMPWNTVYESCESAIEEMWRRIPKEMRLLHLMTRTPLPKGIPCG